jgi:hypothetical protein
MASGPDFNAPKCECGVLERLSKEPSVPIEFDAKLNEYHIVGALGEQIMVYRCPFCGGRRTDSRRKELFMHITQAEQVRLIELTRDLRTLDDVLRAFGSPDADLPSTATVKDDGDGRPKTTFYRQLRFARLSDTADVEAVVGLGGQVRLSIRPKHVTDS